MLKAPHEETMGYVNHLFLARSMEVVLAVSVRLRAMTTPDRQSVRQRWKRRRRRRRKRRKSRRRERKNKKKTTTTTISILKTFHFFFFMNRVERDIRETERDQRQTRERETTDNQKGGSSEE